MAWISVADSVIAHSGRTIELHAIDARGSRLLDQGPAVVPGSLRLIGTRLRWRHGSESRSATLR
jgi:hypothetical protein